MYGNCSKRLHRLTSLFIVRGIVLSTSLSSHHLRTCGVRYRRRNIRFVSLSSRNSARFLLWMQEVVMVLPSNGVTVMLVYRIPGLQGVDG